MGAFTIYGLLRRIRIHVCQQHLERQERIKNICPLFTLHETLYIGYNQRSDNAYTCG